MTHDEALLGSVRALLSDRTDTVERRMIGGMCVMVGGHMCCGVTDSALMIRVGPAAYDRTLTEQHVRPMEIAGGA